MGNFRFIFYNNGKNEKLIATDTLFFQIIPYLCADI